MAAAVEWAAHNDSATVGSAKRRRSDGQMGRTVTERSSNWAKRHVRWCTYRPLSNWPVAMEVEFGRVWACRNLSARQSTRASERSVRPVETCRQRRRYGQPSLCEKSVQIQALDRSTGGRGRGKISGPVKWGPGRVTRRRRREGCLRSLEIPLPPTKSLSCERCPASAGGGADGGVWVAASPPPSRA